MSALPPYLKAKATKLEEGPDTTLDPAVPPTPAEVRSAPVTIWPPLDRSRGPAGPPDPPQAFVPVDPAIRSVPAFVWAREAPETLPNRPRTLGIPVPDLDPDVAMWPVTPVQRWPFSGPPTEGQYPTGWLGVDNTGTVYVCTRGGSPGTWVAVGGAVSGAVTYAAVVTDGVTDNYAYLQALVDTGPAGQGLTVIMPDGPAAVSDTITLPQGVTLRWLRPGPDFETAPEINATPLPGGGLVALSSFSGDSTGAVVHMVGGATPTAQGQCAVSGGYINAIGHAERALYIDCTECIVDQTTCMGGTIFTIDSSSNASRVRLKLCHVNNIKNSDGLALAGGSINVQGPDWVCTGVVKKGGTMLIGAADSTWVGGHLTGGSAQFSSNTGGTYPTTYNGANIVAQNEGRFGDVTFDSLSGANGLIVIDRAGQSSPLQISDCKWLGSTMENAPAILHLNASDAPVQVNGADIDAIGSGDGFTALISSPVPGDSWSGTTTITVDGWSNGTGGNANPASTGLWIVDATRQFPFGRGNFVYNGNQVQPDVVYAALTADIAISATATTLITLPNLLPGNYLLSGHILIECPTTLTGVVIYVVAVADSVVILNGGTAYGIPATTGLAGEISVPISAEINVFAQTGAAVQLSAQGATANATAKYEDPILSNSGVSSLTALRTT